MADTENIIKKSLKKFEVRLFVEKDIILNNKQRNKIIKISKDILDSKINDLIMYYKLNNEYLIKIESWHNDIHYYIYNDDGKYIIDKYYYKETIFDTIDSLKTETNVKQILSTFNIEIVNKKLNDKINDFKYLFQEYGLKLPPTDFQIIRRWDNSFLLSMIEEYMADKEIINDILKVNCNISNTLFYILDVIEGKDNVRISKAYDITIKDYIYFLVSPDSDIYNYIDVNRPIMMNYSNDWIAFDICSQEEFKAFINNYVVFSKTFSEGLPNRFADNNEVLSGKNKLMLLEAKREREKELARIKNEKYKEAINNLHEKPFVKNGITFEEYKITYEKITIDTYNHFNFKLYLSTKSIDELVDFNTLMNFILKSMVYKFIYDTKWNIPANIRWRNVYNLDYTYNIDRNKDLQFEVDNKLITIKYDGSKYYINDIRINKNEIAEALTHILCYNSIDDYNKFLKSVSKCSLKFHKAISNGVKHTYHLNGEPTYVELKMVRDKSINYLVLGKKKLRINNTNALIDWNGWTYTEFIHMLVNTVNISFKEIKQLLKEGIERHKKAVEKSEKLLKETIKILGVEKKTVENKEGYAIKGASGTEYLVEEESCKVWRIMDSAKLDYVCIVDKTSEHQIGKDKLVSRLYALKNDTFVAQDITTLKL